jgi:mRNA interferase HigB
MLVVGLEHVESFLREHAECRQELSELVRDVDGARIPDPNALRDRYPSVKIIDGRMAVFKVRGNKYRLIARIAYNTQVFVILAVETHAAYDKRRLR